MAERPEEPETELDISSEPISPASAIAIGLHKGRKGRAASDPEFDAFLKDQRELINLQKEHLHEQRALILSRLRWGRFSDRMKALLQVMTALVALAMAIAVGVMAWSASQDRSLVIEPFSAPPAFAQDGFGGQVIAADISERMDTIRRGVAGAFSGATDVTADAQDGVKLEIPETGVSLAELSRALRQWLGAERTIEGSLRQTRDGGIELKAHLAGHDPVAATGAAGQIEGLERQVAEQLFAQIDPENWANYLDWSGRRAEGLAAMARLPGLARSTADRADAYSLWSDHMHDPVRAEALVRTALSIDPRLATTWVEMVGRELELGHDQSALADARRALTTRNEDQSSEVRGAGFRASRRDAQIQIDQLAGDFQAAIQEEDSTSQTGNLDISVNAMRTAMAAHDAPAARSLMAEIMATGDARVGLSARLYADLAADDWPAAARDATQLVAADDQARASAANADDQGGVWWTEQVVDRPFLAEARLQLGDAAGAAAAIAPTPLDCYPCLRERGRIAAMQGNWPEADRWFAEAMRQGPSLPFADTDWGEMLLRKGDAAGAILKLKEAHRLGPHFADALEAWGEALMVDRDYAGAVPKFTEADKDAPKWGKNHLRWGEALMLSGRYAEARTQYVTASGLDLSKPDRAALNLLLARTAKGPLHG
jgi:tetratricopeptide (TPR) repeat protein